MPRVIENLKEKILAEAKRQMREVGYGAMTIQSIARACGVGVGTVYNYFPSKDEIVIASVAADWMEHMQTIRTVTRYATTYESVVRCIYDQIHAFGVEHEYVFQDAAAANSVDGAIYRFTGFLSARLAEPLRKFCESDSQAQIIAEALLTWTRTGKSYDEVWGSIVKLFG